jgi:phage terminase large subunit
MTTVTSGTQRWLADESARDETPLDPAAAKAAARKKSSLHLGYEPFPKQQLFHGASAKYRLFGGAAGPGKSKALLMETILQAQAVTGANTLLLRRTFPELEQSLLLYFRRDVPRELYKSFHESKHVVTWLNGSTTRFGYCASENDVYQYQGAEFVFIGIDELTLFTLRQWQFLTSRNRCPVPGSFPCMAAATNPGNIGHAWVKSLWIDKQAASGMESPEQYDPADYAFIPAQVYDNPIYANDAGYIKTLTALPTHLRRAFLDGDWDVFAGQYFDRFDPSTQVFRAEQIDWKPWWPRWISIDWGFEHPSAVYWHASLPAAAGAPAAISQAEAFASGAAALPSRRAPLPANGAATPELNRSRVITYREHVTHRTPPRQLAREIIELSLCSAGILPASLRADGESQTRRLEAGATNESPREKIDAIYLSPDAFARRTDEASIAEQMGDVFVAAGLPRPVPADDDRVGGWMLMYQMLDAGEWLLTENCIELIRTLPNLIRDPARIEDVEKMDGDDPADAARYGLKTRYAAHSSRQPLLPLEQRIAQRVTSSDPTVRAIQIHKAQLEESRRNQPVSFLRRRR